MKKLRRFLCGSCGGAYEKLVKDDIISITCKCNSKATRVISTPRYLSNTVGKSPARR